MGGRESWRKKETSEQGGLRTPHPGVRVGETDMGIKYQKRRLQRVFSVESGESRRVRKQRPEPAVGGGLEWMAGLVGEVVPSEPCQQLSGNQTER
jgi:hypothetical protein